MRNSRKNRRIKAFKSYMQAFQVLRPEHTQIVNGGGCVGHYPCRETSGIGPAGRLDAVRMASTPTNESPSWVEKAFLGGQEALPA